RARMNGARGDDAVAGRCGGVDRNGQTMDVWVGKTCAGFLTRRRRNSQKPPAAAAHASADAGSGTTMTAKLSKLAGLATCRMAATASPSAPNVLPLLTSKPLTVAVSVPVNRLPTSAVPVGPKSSKMAVAE